MFVSSTFKRLLFSAYLSNKSFCDMVICMSISLSLLFFGCNSVVDVNFLAPHQIKHTVGEAESLLHYPNHKHAAK